MFLSYLQKASFFSQKALCKINVLIDGEQDEHLAKMVNTFLKFAIEPVKSLDTNQSMTGTFTT